MRDADAGERWTVLAALAPGALIGVFYFGRPALLVLIAAAAGAVALEALLARASAARPRPTAAALAGLLVGMSLPPAAPLWLPLVGCAAAVLLERLVRVRFRRAPLHPVLGARALLLLCFPGPMTSWSVPGGLFAAASGAVRADQLAQGPAVVARGVSLLDGLVGRVPGGIGETSVIALAAGGLFLLRRGVICWQVPAAFVGSELLLAAAGSWIAPGRFPGAGVHLVSGGLLLGAVFLAADAASAPAAPRGRLLFGAGCGLLTWLIRSFGWYPAGVPFGILLASSFTPLIDLYTLPGGADEPADRGAA
jgi:electron transport complex protein RnfD